MLTTIYHNPKCSKSRRTLEILTEAGHEPRIIRYVDEPPTIAQLRELCAMLGVTPRQLLRTGEPVYREVGLDRMDIDDDALLAVMHNHPVLIQRPIVVAGKSARIGRPPEAVLDLFEQEDGS